MTTVSESFADATKRGNRVRNAHLHRLWGLIRGLPDRRIRALIDFLKEQPQGSEEDQQGLERPELEFRAAALSAPVISSKGSGSDSPRVEPRLKSRTRKEHRDALRLQAHYDLTYRVEYAKAPSGVRVSVVSYPEDKPLVVCPEGYGGSRRTQVLPPQCDERRVIRPSPSFPIVYRPRSTYVRFQAHTDSCSWFTSDGSFMLRPGSFYMEDVVIVLEKEIAIATRRTDYDRFSHVVNLNDRQFDRLLWYGEREPRKGRKKKNKS